MTKSMDEQTSAVPVFAGTSAQCFEFGLVLDAKGVGYERVPAGTAWMLLVAPALAELAKDELSRYAAEPVARREVVAPFTPFGGGALGACVYAGILILTAYCAGIQAVGMDWLAAGAVDARAGGDWWRPVTALTRHIVDPVFSEQ